MGWEPLEDGGKVVWARLDFTHDDGPVSLPGPRDGATDPLRARATGAPASTPQHPAPALSAAPAATDGAVPVAAGVVGEIAAARLGAGVLAAALEALPDGVAIFDGEWTIGYVNPAGAALLGRPAGELVGRNIWVALPELGGTILHDFLLHARGVGEPVTWAGFYPPADRWLSVTAGTQERLLGSGTACPRTDHEALLSPGDTVLFYTDGLVETGRTGIDEGIARLATELALLRAVPVDELCDRLLARIAPGRTDDDIAVLCLHAGTDG